MRLVVGLGNPGPRYDGSRHNVGFMVVDELARRWGGEVSRYERRFEALADRVQRGSAEVLLLKPTTFMNLSGRSVAAARRFFKIEVDDILVVHDDLDLALGQLRIRPAGSAGGHKGLGDVIRQLATDQVARLRIGIDKVHASATVDHVLSRFAPDERPVVEAAIGTAADAVACWLARGIDAAMNEYNRKRGGDSRGTASSQEGESP